MSDITSPLCLFFPCSLFTSWVCCRFILMHANLLSLPAFGNCRHPLAPETKSINNKWQWTDSTWCWWWLSLLLASPGLGLDTATVLYKILCQVFFFFFKGGNWWLWFKTKLLITKGNQTNACWKWASSKGRGQLPATKARCTSQPMLK